MTGARAWLLLGWLVLILSLSLVSPAQRVLAFLTR